MTESPLLQKILQDIREIPPLPEVAAKVLHMTNDPDVSAAELNRVISTDEALTANVLRLCNSAYYGLPRVISSVTQAIMYLGLQTVRNMVLSTTMDHVYSKQDMSAYDYTATGLSEHSFAAAVGAQVISKKLRPGLGDTAFTAGLLHDVGKIVLAQYVRGHQDRLHELAGSPRITPAAENEVLGVDHAHVGSQIADVWNFPQELTLAIGYHHHPEEAKGRPLLAVITQLADVVCLRLGTGLLGGPCLMPISEYCSEATGYTEDGVEDLCQEVQAALQATAQVK
jgi:putative nucleotidyltransferase with HDIG domain